jgi:hypothetical protein
MENLGMKKSCPKTVPKSITNNQLQRMREACAGLPQRIKENNEWRTGSLLG